MDRCKELILLLEELDLQWRNIDKLAKEFNLTSEERTQLRLEME